MRIVKQRARKRGLTLIELTIAMMMSLIVASSLMAVVSQQVNFVRLMNAHSFLRDEAPQINLLLTRMLSSATSYRIYADKSDAFAGNSAVNTGGTAVLLTYRQPDGTAEERAVVFETVSGETQLNFYSNDGGWGANPDWTITSQPAAVDFANDSGVLLVTVTGPNQEQITYVGK